MAKTDVTSTNYVERDDVVQYLGIKYASIDHRFAGAQLYDYGSIDTIQANVHG